MLTLKSSPLFFFEGSLTTPASALLQPQQSFLLRADEVSSKQTFAAVHEFGPGTFQACQRSEDVCLLGQTGVRRETGKE
jgi:hypothetical protein